MRFAEVTYSQVVADKLWNKHRVDISEVDEVLEGKPYVRRGPQRLYYVLGQTQAGRYLFVVLREVGEGQARLLTARDMDDAERRIYRRR